MTKTSKTSFLRTANFLSTNRQWFCTLAPWKLTGHRQLTAQLVLPILVLSHSLLFGGKVWFARVDALGDASLAMPG